MVDTKQCDHIGQFIALWANFSKSAVTIMVVEKDFMTVSGNVGN